MHAERTVNLNETTLRDATANISGLIESAVTALVTLGDPNRITRPDNRQKCILQGFVNKKIDEELNSIRFKSPLL